MIADKLNKSNNSHFHPNLDAEKQQRFKDWRGSEFSSYMKICSSKALLGDYASRCVTLSVKRNLPNRLLRHHPKYMHVLNAQFIEYNVI
jgi:hypothetical protein